MKIQILAGALSLVLLLGMVPTPAEAKIFIIDDFSDDTGGFCDFGVSLIIAPVSFAQPAAVLGGERECMLAIDVESPPSNAVIDVVALPDDVPAVPPSPDMFRHMAGSGVESITMLEYDGVGVDAGAAGLGISLLSSDDIQIDYSLSDFQVDVTVRVTDSGGDFAEQTGVLAAGTITPTSLNFVIQNFIDAPSLAVGVLNLGDIDRIKFTFDTLIDVTDYDLDKLHITMEMVGGEMFPVNTTALLLAGVELNAIWILPLIAAIGIGAFVVSRKRN